MVPLIGMCFDAFERRSTAKTPKSSPERPQNRIRSDQYRSYGAFGRLLDLQVGLLGQLWTAKLASWSAWSLKVGLPRAL